jgi:hypothetical protein
LSETGIHAVAERKKRYKEIRIYASKYTKIELENNKVHFLSNRTTVKHTDVKNEKERQSFT